MLQNNEVIIVIIFMFSSLVYEYFTIIDMQGKSRSNRKEQQSQQQMKQSYIKCKHCGKQILANNYLIHQARCTLMSSRLQKNQMQEKPETKHEEPIQNLYNFKKQQPKKEEVRSSNQQVSQSERKGTQNIGKNKIQKQEQIQRIPCPFCGYPQTLAELDTHPLQCEHREEACAKCGNKFPKSLMRQHLQVCRSNQPPQQSHNNQRWMHQMDQHQEEDNYNPFGNLRNLLFSPRMAPESSMRRPGYTIIQRTDGRGHVHRDIIIGEPPGLNRGAGNQYSSPFANFFAVLQFMAGRNAQQNQGLTKEQIKNLRKFNYQGHNVSNKEGEKDLCTICYCQFQKGEKLVELKCKHAYHEQCITKWVEKTAKCPVCKAPQTNRPIFNQQQQGYF